MRITGSLPHRGRVGREQERAARPLTSAQTEDWPHGLELCSPQLRCLACQKGASACCRASAGILAAGPVQTILLLGCDSCCEMIFNQTAQRVWAGSEWSGWAERSETRTRQMVCAAISAGARGYAHPCLNLGAQAAAVPADPEGIADMPLDAHSPGAARDTNEEVSVAARDTLCEVDLPRTPLAGSVAQPTAAGAANHTRHVTRADPRAMLHARGRRIGADRRGREASRLGEARPRPTRWFPPGRRRRRTTL